MADGIYLAGDFSGIQRFVLRVKTAGKAQAKRLRARSFLLQLLEHATLSILRARFALDEEDVLVQGGGGFLVRLRAATDNTGFQRLAIDLQHMLWEECGGQIQVSLGWAATPAEARAEVGATEVRAGALFVAGAFSQCQTETAVRKGGHLITFDGRSTTFDNSSLDQADLHHHEYRRYSSPIVGGHIQHCQRTSHPLVSPSVRAGLLSTDPCDPTSRQPCHSSCGSQ